MPSRRTVLKLGAAPFLIGRAPLVRAAAPHVAVIGAGAFGGWTAWWLAQRGARVADLVLTDGQPDRQLRLSRFATR